MYSHIELVCPKCSKIIWKFHPDKIDYAEDILQCGGCGILWDTRCKPWEPYANPGILKRHNNVPASRYYEGTGIRPEVKLSPAKLLQPIKQQMPLPPKPPPPAPRPTKKPALGGVQL